MPDHTLAYLRRACQTRLEHRIQSQRSVVQIPKRIAQRVHQPRRSIRIVSNAILVNQGRDALECEAQKPIKARPHEACAGEARSG